MIGSQRLFWIGTGLLLAVLVASFVPTRNRSLPEVKGAVTVREAVAHDVSPALSTLRPVLHDGEAPQKTPLTSASVEQTSQGMKPAPEIVASFDGLGDGFEGPQGTATFRNPSDNSLA